MRVPLRTPPYLAEGNRADALKQYRALADLL